MVNKKNILFLYVFFVVNLQCSERGLFEQANVLYDARDFTSALEAYKKINDKGYTVWYNMGNAYFELEDYLRALISWKRAERQAASIHELATVKHSVQHAYSKLNMSYADDSIRTMLGYTYIIFPPLAIQILFIVMTCLLLFFARIMAYKKHFRFLVLLGLCWMLLSILVLVHYGQHALHGYVVAENAQLRTKPDVTQPVVLELKRGSEIIIQQTILDWYKIKAKNYSGWIATKDVEVV